MPSKLTETHVIFFSKNLPAKRSLPVCVGNLWFIHRFIFFHTNLFYLHVQLFSAHLFSSFTWRRNKAGTFSDRMTHGEPTGERRQDAEICSSRWRSRLTEPSPTHTCWYNKTDQTTTQMPFVFPPSLRRRTVLAQTSRSFLCLTF